MRFSPTYPEYHGNRRQPKMYDAVRKKVVPRDSEGNFIATMEDWPLDEIASFYDEHWDTSFYKSDAHRWER